MRWNHFFGSIAFGAVVALLYVPMFTLLGSSGETLCLYLVLVAASYVAGLGKTVRRGLGASLFVGTVLTIGTLLLGVPTLIALGALGLFSLMRSGLLYQQPMSRSLLIESLLFFASAMVGAFFLGQSPLGAPFAVFAVFVVQSAFFLTLREAPPKAGAANDPFAQAMRRANALLEG